MEENLIWKVCISEKYGTGDGSLLFLEVAMV